VSAMTSPDANPGGSVRWRNLRTGLLFVFGIALIGTLGLIIGKNTGLLSKHDTAYIFVEDIRGLTEGNMVSISGKKVGTIKAMHFTSRHDTSGITIELDIRDEYFGLITRDSRAVIKSLGVLGDKYIDIALGRSPQPFRDGDFLAAEMQPGVEELTASALQTMDQIASVSEKINRGEGTIGRLISSTELSDRLVGAASGFEEISKRLLHGSGPVAVLLNDEALAHRMKSGIADLSALAASVRSGQGTLGKLFVDESLYQSLNSISRRSDSLMARLNSPEGSIGRFARDTSFYVNLNRTIASLDSLLVDLKQNPGRYVKLSLF
jgi:phospholipid/cholesterol/gamma-HCH transport system substrate-binding protein